MDKWEYTVALLGDSGASKVPVHMSLLNEQGKEGWELVQIIQLGPNFFAYMKRLAHQE